MFQRLRTKLAVLYAGLFGAGLVLISLTVYAAISSNARGVVQGELVASGTVFDRIWAMRAAQLETGADLLSRDFGFREAVASRDEATIRSALQNLQARFAIDRAFIVGVDGQVIAADRSGCGAAAAQIRDALMTEDAPSGVMAIDHELYQTIAAPILSPTLAGWVVFAAKLDVREIGSLERLSAIPLNATVLGRDGAGRWVAAGSAPAAFARVVEAALAEKQPEPTEFRTPAGEVLILVKPLKAIGGDRRAALIISYPMARAMAPYQSLLAMIVAIGVGGLGLLLGGSFVLARSVTRPISALDEAVQRLQRGQSATVAIDSADEMGRLARSFNSMAAEIRERERRITHLALHDPDSDLPNRLSLARSIEAMAHRAAERGQKIAVAVLSVDRFVQVRGAIGFGQADALMAEIGQALQKLRPGDPVARISNSFLGIAFLAASAEDACRNCARLQHALEAPVSLGETTIDISLTVGLAILPDHASRPGALINRANVAVEQAHARQARLAVFDPEAYGDPASTLSLMSEMLVAIISGEIYIDLQPKFDLALGRTIGAEALVRWRHPARGSVPPDAFIPLAEETGHIRALTEYVLALAISQQAELAQRGYDLSMAVNLSGRLLGDPEFAERALDLAADAKGELWLEITETAVVANPALAVELLDRFSAAGLKISIDDFGSGLSSLAYLKQIRADELKIDKSFIVGMAEGGRDALLVRSAIDLAHNLGLKATAEGVERVETQALLIGMGCDLAQGYGIARPMPLADFLVFLEQEEELQASYGRAPA